jgi:hypothetical protein
VYQELGGQCVGHLKQKHKNGEKKLAAVHNPGVCLSWTKAQALMSRPRRPQDRGQVIHLWARSCSGGIALSSGLVTGADHLCRAFFLPVIRPEVLLAGLLEGSVPVYQCFLGSAGCRVPHVELETEFFPEL